MLVCGRHKEREQSQPEVRHASVPGSAYVPSWRGPASGLFCLYVVLRLVRLGSTQTGLDAMSLLQRHEAGSEALGVPAGIVPGNGRLDAAFRRAGVAGVAFCGLLESVLTLLGEEWGARNCTFLPLVSFFLGAVSFV
jgi:hypothetical protein